MGEQDQNKQDMNDQDDVNQSSAAAIEEERRIVATHFDANYYLASNEDVRDAGIDPLTHFIVWGWREGRNPSYSFDTNHYLKNNPDVAAADVNPLVHYVQFGAKEGRAPLRLLDGWRRQLDASIPLRQRAADPSRTADRTPPINADVIIRALDAANTVGLAVSVSHDDYKRHVGGVQLVIDDEQHAFGRVNWSYLHVSPEALLWMLADPTSASDFQVFLRLDGEQIGVATFRDLIEAVSHVRDQGAPVECIVHHFLGHAPELVLDLVRASGAGRANVWVHDFFTCCPSYALMRNDVAFCHGPPVSSATCGICSYGEERSYHLARVREFFDATRPVVLAPSQVALDTWRHCNDLSHAEGVVLPIRRLLTTAAGTGADVRAPGRTLRIAHLGSRSLHKGWPVFEKLALDLANDDRYAFYQLGIQRFGPPLPGYIRNIPVEVVGGRRNAMIEAVAEARIDVVISWSLWPETFCIAVHEGLAGGAFIVARAGAGNVWPAVKANAPDQGVAIDNESELFELFEGDELRQLVETAPRHRGALLPGRGTADWLLPSRRARFVGPTEVISISPRKRPANARRQRETQMAEVHCFTSASFAYLDRVRVLGETLRRHHPEWTFWLCLSDQEPAGFTFDLAREPIDHVVRLMQLDVPDLRRWIFDHDVIELCTAVKGAMLCRLLDDGARKVIYLDPDIALFSDLHDVEALLDQHDVILTPHQLEPDEEKQAILDNEIGSALKHGIYNLGFLAVANTDEGMRFARWWRDRLIDFCYDDIPNGLFTDQRWCDLAPAFFPGVHILRDPGYNVASWNLSRRPITFEADGSIKAGGHTLRFFHFTKITGPGATMIERYSHGQIAVFELMHWYRTRLVADAPVGLPPKWWAYSRYADGVPIPKAHRRTYRSRADLRERFPDPFAAGPGSLREYLEQELD